LEDGPQDLATLSPSTNGVTYSMDMVPESDEQFQLCVETLKRTTPDSLWAYSLIGSCIVVPRPVLDRIGLFDKRYFAYYNDLDYHLTALSRGLVTYTTSRSLIYHYGGKSGHGQDILQKKEEDKKKFLDKWGKCREFLNQYFTALS